MLTTRLVDQMKAAPIAADALDMPIAVVNKRQARARPASGCRQSKQPGQVSDRGRQRSVAIADNWPDGDLRAVPVGPLVNSGNPSNNFMPDL